MRTIARSWLALIVVFVLVAQHGAAQERPFTIGMMVEVTGLDPRMNFDTYSMQPMLAILEPLLVLDTDLRLQPRLAERWTFAEDGTEITFELREGVTFHHGRPFTSADVRYTFEWMLDTENPSRNQSAYADIVEILTPDDHTVVFRLGEANVFFINTIAQLGIVPEDLGRDHLAFNQAPVGTGPYRFVRWQRDDVLEIEAFDGYWGDQPGFARVEFRPIPEDGTRLLGLEAGEVDLYQGGVLTEEVPRLEEDARFTVQRVAGGFHYVGFNTRAGALADVRVRQAINYAIPRDAIVGRLLNDVGQSGVGPLSPSSPWFNPDVPRFDYDPERARALLDEAGYGPGELSVLILAPTGVRAQVAEILQFELDAIGVDATVSIEEFGALNSRIIETDDYELFVFGWSFQIDPDLGIRRIFGSMGGSNNSYYANARVDELVELGRTLPPDSQASYDAYAEAQALIVAEVPFAFVYYTEEVAVHRADVEGWVIHPVVKLTYQDLHRLRPIAN